MKTQWCKAGSERSVFLSLFPSKPLLCRESGGDVQQVWALAEKYFCSLPRNPLLEGSRGCQCPGLAQVTAEPPALCEGEDTKPAAPLAGNEPCSDLDSDKMGIVGSMGGVGRCRVLNWS